MRPPYSKLRQRGGFGERNPVVLGRKFCVRCGRWRQVNDFRRCANSPNGLHAYCYACHRAYEREYRATREPPEVRARRLEYQRFWWEAQTRKRGITQRVRRRTVIDRKERLYLDPAPILRLATLYIRTRRAREDPPVYGWKNLAQDAGIHERALYRYRVGESAHIQVDMADRLAAVLGMHLDNIYV